MAKRPKNWESSMDAVRDELAALKQAIGKLNADGAGVATAVSRSTNRLAKLSKSEASGLTSQSMDLGRDALAVGGSAVRTGLAMAVDEFRRNPLGAAMVTIGLGLLVGALRHR